MASMLSNPFLNRREIYLSVGIKLATIYVNI